MNERLKYLFGEEWYKELEPFLLSPKFAAINRYIAQERNFGRTIFPEAKSDDNFRCYRLTQPSDIKVVILGHHYDYDGSFDGILWSGSKLIEQSLILKTVLKECEVGYPIEYNNLACGLDEMDLSRWGNQGVFMLPTELTYEKSKPLSHLPLWNEFILETINIINKKNNICWVLIGESVWTFQDKLNKLHRKIVVKDPLKNSNNILGLFNNINEFLDAINKKNIIW